MYLRQGLPCTTLLGQKAFLILRLTSSSLSSMKMAELGSLFDIFSWPCTHLICYIDLPGTVALQADGEADEGLSNPVHLVPLPFLHAHVDLQLLTVTSGWPCISPHRLPQRSSGRIALHQRIVTKYGAALPFGSASSLKQHNAMLVVRKLPCCTALERLQCVGGRRREQHTSKSPGSISWDRMTGFILFSFFFSLSQYSLASMLTFLWSMPS